VASALAAFTAAASGPGAAHAAAAESRFSRAEWVELVRLYARGERAQAIAGLAAWSERDLARQVTSVEQAARAAERCPGCPRALDEFPLRAATMLHWDVDRDAQTPPVPGDNEQPRRCPGPAAVLAGRLARLAARHPDTAAFAHRFLRLVVLQCQWDACFTDAELWATDAVEMFPMDTALLLTRGSVREEVATIGWRCAAPAGAPSRQTSAADADIVAGRRKLEAARQDFAQALAIDPSLGLAHLRLGRVLWRLGEPDQARAQLEAALTSAVPPDQVYLARLFLGRLHQEAGRMDDAIREYTLAAEMHPGMLSAATALSSALLLGGDAPGARKVLRQGLNSSGRAERDPLWDYLVLNAADLDALRDALRRESLE